MLRFPFRRRSKVAGVVALGIGSDGLSLVHAADDENGQRHVELCEFHEAATLLGMQTKLIAAVKEHDLTGARCSVVLPPDRYALRQIDTPDVHPDELNDAVRWAIRDLIDFSAAEAIVDYFEIPEPTGVPATRIYVVACRPGTVREIVDLVEPSGLELDAIEIGELSLRNIARLLPEDPNGVGVMTIEDGAGHIALCKEKALYLARTFNCALEVLEEDHVEAGKKRTASAGDADQMLDGILLETQRSLDYFQHTLGNERLHAIYVGPLPAAATTIQEHLAANLPVRVHAIDLNQVIQRDEYLPEEVQRHCLVAVGASLREDGADTQEVNLYPQEIRSGQEVMPARILLLGVAGATCIMFAALCWSIYTMFATESELGTLDAQRAELQLQRDNLQNVADRLKEDPALDAEIKKRRNVLRERTRVLSALVHQDTHNAEGFSPYLVSLAKKKVDGIWLERIEIGRGGNEIKLVGKSLRPSAIPELIRRLAGEGPFEGKQFKTMTIGRPEGNPAAPYVEFELATGTEDPKK